MFRTLVTAAVLVLLTNDALAGESHRCRSSIPGAGNESYNELVFAFAMGIAIHRLAETRCGARQSPMRPKFLDFIKKQGCGPSTEIYQYIEKVIADLEASDMTEANYKELLSGIGGCVEARKFHDQSLEKFARSICSNGGC